MNFFHALHGLVSTLRLYALPFAVCPDNFSILAMPLAEINIQNCNT